MDCVGTIVEFNPLHNGHVEHLHLTRALAKKEKIIAVTSGNFVQRGEPALCDKWLRTRMALLAGVDIVIEIPVPYVISGADYFARAGVGILAATGVVGALSFGSECGDITAIREAGRVLAEEPPAYKNVLRTRLDSGASFAAARGAALEATLATRLSSTPEGLLTKPNNGLAMEYCKALHLLERAKSMKNGLDGGENRECFTAFSATGEADSELFRYNPMEVFTTHRKSGGPSATKIRTYVKECSHTEDIPSYVAEILSQAKKNGHIAVLDDFSDIFRFLLYSRDFDLGEGLENRFKNLCGEFTQISDLLAAVKTKRYTHTRLQRVVIQMLLDITSDDMDFFEGNGGVQYIRVLGFRSESADLLGAIVKNATLPVITHGAAIDSILNGEHGNAAAKMLECDLRAGDIYRCATRTVGGHRAERAFPIVKV